MSRSNKIAVYPGTFDPVTNGHIDIIERSLKIFEKLIVAVLVNTNKKPLLTVEERLELLRQSVARKHHHRVIIDSFKGLLVNYVKQKNAHIIIRGLRAVSDFEFEFQMANMNRHLNKNIETVFMMTGEESFYISSTFIRDVALFGGSVKKMVPKAVYQKLKEKHKILSKRVP